MKICAARRVAIVTDRTHCLGGVETVNEMLVAMLRDEGFATTIVSREALGDKIVTKVAQRLFGTNRLLARHFNRRHLHSTEVAICNGEFSFGVRHPAAIASFHGCYYGYARALRPFIKKRLYRGLMRLADQQRLGAAGKYVVGNSRALGLTLEEQGMHVDEIIDNAIDTDLFRPRPEVARNDRCLFVGSSDYHGKGFDILEKLADRGLRIDCVTPTRPRDGRLRWLGSIPNEGLARIYPGYKALVFPSRFEGCGLVALEAMACGTPVAMTAVGAGLDIVREIPEFVVDGPWEEIPDKIMERLRAIESAQDALSRRGREYVLRHHGWELWKTKWLRVLDLVAQRAARPRV